MENYNFKSELWDKIIFNKYILIEENNLYSLSQWETLLYYYRKDNEDFSYIKELEYWKNYRIFDKIENEIWFISFIFDKEDKDLYIEYFIIYDSYSNNWIWKDIIKLLINNLKPLSLSWEIINADNWYTYYFWESIKNNICIPNNIKFDMVNT